MMTASFILVFEFSNFQVGKSVIKLLSKAFKDLIAKVLKAKDLTKVLREIDMCLRGIYNFTLTLLPE